MPWHEGRIAVERAADSRESSCARFPRAGLEEIRLSLEFRKLVYEEVIVGVSAGSLYYRSGDLCLLNLGVEFRTRSSVE